MEVSVNDAIGLNLWAAKPVKLLDHPDNGKVIDTVPANGFVGQIFSWIERPSGIYWMFRNSKGRYYYVLHQGGAFTLTKQIKQAADKTQLEYDKAQSEIDKQREELLKDEKGVIPYYIEKYGKVLLITAVAYGVVKALINKSK